jgi:transposase
LPGVVRTWAPKGQTPILHHKLTRDHLSVISAITPAGDLYLQVRETAFDSGGVIAFLDELQQQITGKLLIIWDGATIHRSKLLKQYLAEGAAARLHLERLPGYAPELNPDEGVWHYLKHVELGNLCCRDLPHLWQEVCAAAERLRQKPQIVTGFFEQVGFL